MSNINVFTLKTNNKIAYKKADCFDFIETEEAHEYTVTGIIKNIQKFSKRILPSLEIKNKKYRNNLYINPKLLKELNKFDIKGANRSEVQSCISEFNKIYSFPELDENESIEFAKNLAILNLMYSFQRDLALLHYYKPQKCNDSEYIYGTIQPIINNINKTGQMLFTKYYDITEEDLSKCKNIKEIRKYLLPYKNKLLFTVNELSNEISYSIVSYIDIKSHCVNIISNKVFNLIWHIFVNYIVADVAPHKLSFCPICGSLRESTTKKGLKCKKCKDKKIR